MVSTSFNTLFEAKIGTDSNRVRKFVTSVVNEANFCKNSSFFEDIREHDLVLRLALHFLTKFYSQVYGNNQ